MTKKRSCKAAQGPWWIASSPILTTYPTEEAALAAAKQAAVSNAGVEFMVVHATKTVKLDVAAVE